MSVREALLAGSWYPAEPDELRRVIDDALAGPAPKGPFRGLIGPHAGLRYSGRCAGRGYATLGQRRDAELVVVFGSHRGPRGPNTVFLGSAWQTPLGDLECDTELARTLERDCELEAEPLVPGRPDNGVELHLPFIRHCFPKARLLMLGVAAHEIACAIGERVGELCRGRDVVFVGSTDLSHYGPNYDFTPRGIGEAAERFVRDENDRGFIERALDADAPGLIAHAASHQSACCPGAAAATLTALRAYGHAPAPHLVDHYLSCDVARGTSFVGYASIAL